jgi:hypothetical protein
VGTPDESSGTSRGRVGKNIPIYKAITLNFVPRIPVLSFSPEFCNHFPGTPEVIKICLSPLGLKDNFVYMLPPNGINIDDLKRSDVLHFERL